MSDLPDDKVTTYGDLAAMAGRPYAQVPFSHLPASPEVQAQGAYRQGDSLYFSILYGFKRVSLAQIFIRLLVEVETAGKEQRSYY